LFAWYSAALAAQQRSGVSVTRYAQQIGVSPVTLYQWRKRLGAVRKDSSLPPTPPPLVEVVVGNRDQQYRPVADGPCAVVRLRSGQAVEVPRGFDSHDMRRLVALLESC
jgi:transposase-like protein